MAMGKHRKRQESMWIAKSDLPTSPGHPFYQRVNELLDEAKLDAFVEGQCWEFYAACVGRPSVPPGRCFRLLLLDYFEGIDSERGMRRKQACRAVASTPRKKVLASGFD
jgi:hypothetical protein